MAKKPVKITRTAPAKREPEGRAQKAEAPVSASNVAVRPAVIVVGADKGGVGKTTIARAILDFLSLNDIHARAFDTETPRGTLHRFHPDETMIVDLTEPADQMKIIDTYVADANYFMVKSHVNDTTFFEWDPQTHEKYFEDVVTSGEITIPKLSELAYEQVELSGTPFSTFIANQDAQGQPAEHSFVLRGYVRTWLARVADEFERVGLLEIVGDKRR
ncbi:MAG: hypothetical protein HYS63_02285 [Methylocystis sp.]|nr:hypothetical protein [Methylocystis sp.]